MSDAQVPWLCGPSYQFEQVDMVCQDACLNCGWPGTDPVTESEARIMFDDNGDGVCPQCGHAAEVCNAGEWTEVRDSRGALVLRFDTHAIRIIGEDELDALRAEAKRDLTAAIQAEADARLRREAAERELRRIGGGA